MGCNANTAFKLTHLITLGEMSAVRVHSPIRLKRRNMENSQKFTFVKAKKVRTDRNYPSQTFLFPENRACLDLSFESATSIDGFWEKDEEDYELLQSLTSSADSQKENKDLSPEEKNHADFDFCFYSGFSKIIFLEARFPEIFSCQY